MKINFGPSAIGMDTLCSTCNNAVKRTMSKGGSVVNQQQEVWCGVFAYEGYAPVRGNVVQCSRYDGKAFDQNDAWSIAIDPATGEVAIAPSFNARQTMNGVRYLEEETEREIKRQRGPWYARAWNAVWKLVS